MTQANQTKSAAELEYEKLQKKLQKMLKDLPVEDDEHGGCGIGCTHHHHGHRDH